MADKPSSKSERIEAPEVVAPKKSVETSSDVIEKGPKAVIARLKSVKSLESAVLVKRKARSGKTVDKTGKMGNIEYKNLKIKRFENYLKKIGVTRPVDLSDANVNKFRLALKVAAEKYNSDYEFVDYRLMDEIGHYIRSVMSKLYSDISEKNLNKRKSKGEKKLATKTKGADSSVTSGIRRRSKDRGTQKAAERTAALLRRFKR